MVKLPMLLSKPKKNYKSVSKTDLLSADQSATKQETNNDSFNLSEDVTSINETEQEDYIGKISACIQYDDDKNMVVVTIQNFVDLTFVTQNQSFEEKRDVSIKISMFPDNEHADTTNVVNTSTDIAEFQQQIIFTNVHFQRFEISSIQCKIYVDNQLFGAATQEISKIFDKNTNFSEPFEIELNVFPTQEQEESHSSGELLMSLCHQPAARRLSVVILKARNVPKMDISGFSDPYVKIYLHHNNTRSSKKKTHIKKRSLNPVFNESFIFDLPSKDGSLNDVQLEVIMCDWDRITKNEVIGRLILGRDSEGSCATHWEEIQKCPRRPIAQWHKLTGP